MAVPDPEYKYFNSKEFFATSYAKGSPKERFLELMHLQMEKEGYRGGKLLELGTGPSLHTSLLGSKYFSEIVLSEYTEPKRVELVKWLNQEEGALDWSHYVNIVSKLENSDPKLVEQRTRSAIKDIIACDLRNDEPVPPYTEEYFDCIVSSLTIECSFTDMESYNRTMKKLFDLLLPGGRLILFAVFGQTYYNLGGYRYPILKLSKIEAENTLISAGFIDIEMTPVPLTKTISCDGDSNSYITAIKPK